MPLKKVTPSSKSFLILVALFSALPPFAIDTYSPAIPAIAEYFNISPDTVVITFATYFIGFSLGLFIWGPISDKYGRKRVISIGVVLYTLSTIICSLSQEFWQLYSARFVQGFSDASCASVAYAMVRDCYSSKKLTQTIATIGMIVMVAPIVAPMIGAGIIHYTGEWQVIFHFLTILGIILLLSSLKLPETIKEYHTSALHSFKQYFSHLKDYKFLLFAIASALSFTVFFTFVGSSAIVYVKVYGTNEFGFSLLFAINATAIIIANILIKKFSNIVSLSLIEILGCVSSLILCTISLVLVSYYPHSIVLFAILMWFITLATFVSTNSLMSEAVNLLTHSYGAGISVVNILKFGSAGVISYVMSLFNYQSINISMLLTQTCLMLVTVIIVFISIFLLKNKGLEQ